MLVIMLSVLEANIDLNDMNEADAYYNGEEAPNDNTAVGLRMQAKKRQQEKGRWKTTCTFWRYSKCKRMGNLSSKKNVEQNNPPFIQDIKSQSGKQLPNIISLRSLIKPVPKPSSLPAAGSPDQLQKEGMDLESREPEGSRYEIRIFKLDDDGYLNDVEGNK